MNYTYYTCYVSKSESEGARLACLSRVVTAQALNCKSWIIDVLHYQLDHHAEQFS